MELLQLTYFCDAASTQNFSRTAKQFNVPPSNISQSVKRLEEELGVELFTRRANRVTLNSRGEAFYREVSAALDMLRHARNKARGIVEESVLRLGIHISRRVVMQTVAEFRSCWPNIDIVTEHGDYTRSEDFDVVISDENFEDGEFVKVCSFREQIVLAAKKGMFASGVRLQAEDLRDKPFITTGENHSMHNITCRICRELGFKPRIALQGEDPEYIRQCVELGLGVAFAPTVSWRGQFSSEVELHPVGEQSRDICIYKRKSPCQREYADAFCHMLIDNYEKETAQR